MTDTIKLPSGVEVYEGKSVRIPGLGTTVPVGNLTPAEVQALRDDVQAVLDLELGDLSNVSEAGKEPGLVLAVQEDGSWAPGETTGVIERVSTNWNSNAVDEVSLISVGPGIDVNTSFSESGRAHLQLVFGATTDTIARGNHNHVQPLPVRVTTAPSGYISGGSQPLGSTSVTLTNGIAYVVEAELYGQFRGADSGAAYYTLSITIDGNTYTSPGGESGFWCVQGVPDKVQWQHERRLTGTGAAVAVSASAAWHSGSGFNIDRTYLKVRVRPDR